jgi:predicted DNA-binding protein
MADEIRTNSRGVSTLSLKFSLDLRLRAAAMAQATGLSQQQLIRNSIEQHVTAWEQGNLEIVKPTRRKRGAK